MNKRSSKRAVWAAAIILIVVAAIGAGVYSTISPHMPTSASTAVVTNTSLVEEIQTSTSTTTSLMTTTAAAVTTTTTSATLTSTSASGLTTAPATGNGPYVMNCIGSNLNYCQVKVTPTCQNGGCAAPCAGGNCYYNGAPYFCSSYACYYGQPYSYNPQFSAALCQPSSSNNTSSNGTVECSGYLHQDQNGCVELAVPFLAPWLDAQAYEYYTLSNLPSSYPPIGSWVTVTGILQLQSYSGGSYPFGSLCPGNTITVSSIT